MSATNVGGVLLVVCLACGANDVRGQSASTPAPARPRPTSTAQIDAGEPRADTSAVGAREATATATAAPPTSSTVTSSGVTAAGARVKGSAPDRSGSKAADRLALGTATVTGDREQPKVMYIVPWKKSDIGDLSGKPMNSLLDEALAPVDRDEFRREVAYFDAVKADSPHNSRAAGAAKQGEK